YPLASFHFTLFEKDLLSGQSKPCTTYGESSRFDRSDVQRGNPSCQRINLHPLKTSLFLHDMCQLSIIRKFHKGLRKPFVLFVAIGKQFAQQRKNPLEIQVVYNAEGSPCRF